MPNDLAGNKSPNPESKVKRDAANSDSRFGFDSCIIEDESCDSAQDYTKHHVNTEVVNVPSPKKHRNNSSATKLNINKKAVSYCW